MTLKERRKMVSQLAHYTNEILASVRAEMPEALRNKWESVLYHHGTKATKNHPSRFRTTTSRMNTQKLISYEQVLKLFISEMEQKKREKEQYENAGYGAIFPIVDELAKIYYDYYYWNTSVDLFVERSNTVIQNRLARGESQEDISRLIDRAFYMFGEWGGRPGKGKGEVAKYFDYISESGYLL